MRVRCLLSLLEVGEDGDLEHENTTALPDMFWS